MRHFLIIPLACLALVSCLEKSTVVKVGKDGSGIVHVREYMLTHDSEDDVKLPDKSKLEAVAARMGEGVRLQSVAVSKNPKGWFGHEVIYEFDDIDGLVISQSDPEKPSEGDGDTDGKKDSPPVIRFRMAEGVLEASLEDPEWHQPDLAAQPGGSPTIDPYAGTTGPRASGISIVPAGFGAQGEGWKTLTRGMRVGVFLQIEDPLAEANARYSDGPLHTLMNFDMEKIAASDAFDGLDDLDTGSRDEMQQLVDKIEGLEMDLQQPVRFVFE